MSQATQSKQNDFRYAVAEAQIPWHAVGEFYQAEDVLDVVKFLLPDKSESPAYVAQLEQVKIAVDLLAAEGGVATKLSLGQNGQGRRAADL